MKHRGKPVSCIFPSGEVPLNVYLVTISIGGSFYTASAVTFLAVFDPSLGGVQGEGKLAINDPIQANFAISARYNNGGHLQGAVVFIEHLPGGQTNVVQSTSLSSLTIVGNTAVLTGKSLLTASATTRSQPPRSRMSQMLRSVRNRRYGVEWNQRGQCG